MSSAICLGLLSTAVVLSGDPGRFVSNALGGQSTETLVELVVTVPVDTPAAAKLFAAGNLPELGGWKPDGLELSRSDDGTYSAHFNASPGSKIEFKITQGAWTSVERDTFGRDIANRTLTVEQQPDGKSQRIEVTVHAWSAVLPRRSTVTGLLKLHHEFSSQHLTRSRTLSVWLPPGYETTSDRYPVLYLHDGQNLFDAATAAFGVEWQADETATRLIAERRIPAIIIVGIGNTPDRLDEYSPTRDERLKRGGRGSLYARFLVEEVKPFIDRTYRTRPDRESTAIGGSSLGGLISMQVCELFPETFFACAAISPALGWDQEFVVKGIQKNPAWIHTTRLWIDMGTREGGNSPKSSVDRTKQFANALEQAGRKENIDFRYLEVPDGQHNETAWAARFDRVLEFLFADRNRRVD